MFKKVLKGGLRVVKTTAKVGVGLVQGQRGVGYGVGEYEDFDKIRESAAERDRAEGVTTAGGEWEAISDGTQEISAEDLRVMFEVEEGDDLPVLVDVREDHEWKDGHIPAAVHVPLGKLELRATELDRNRTVITYCASGMRSIDGSYVLKRAGFPRVQSLAGGIDAWKGAGNEVIVPD